MKYLIDSGHLEDICRLAAVFPLSGLTTNPDIIAREKTHPLQLYRRIHREVPQLKIFHIQVVSRTADAMIREACHVMETLTCGEDAFQKEELSIKVPVNREGVAAMMKLEKLGVQVTATGIFNTTQCLVAADVGAAYAAPYITPIIACGGDGIAVIREASAIYAAQGYDTQILGAGFSVEAQVAQAALAGAPVVTLPVAILDKMLNVPQTETYTDRFNGLFQAYAGEGRSLLDFD